MISEQRVSQYHRYGCVVCRNEHNIHKLPELHHLVEGYRLGDDHVIPLCSWHHRGVPPSPFLRPSDCEKLFGPSLARNKRAFVERFGNEKQLLEQVRRELGWTAGADAAKAHEAS